MLVGIDVGGTNARALLVQGQSCAVVDRDSATTAATGPELVRVLAGMVERLRGRNDCEIDGIGLGVAGLAHRSGTLRYSPNLPLLAEFPLGGELAAAVGRPVAMTNDATAAALAEARLGSGRGVDDFVLVTLGTGVGVGFVCGGALVGGHSGFAGEAGHMTVDVDGPVHVTGKRGPWEHFASGTRLGELGRMAAAAGRFDAGIALAGEVDSIDGLTVSAALGNDDPDAVAILERFCGDVAVGVANLVLILDPQRVALGGGLAEIGEPLRSGVQRRLGELLPGAGHRPDVEVVTAELGDDAGALGAALWALSAADS